MANIKTLKKQLKTTKSTYKITSAMKLVSAAKMNKFQDLLLKSEAYTREIEEIALNCLALNRTNNHYLLKANKTKHSYILVLSSDRGLCGSYNQQLAKHVQNFLDASDDIYKVFFWGSRAKELINYNNLGEVFIHELGENFQGFIQTIADRFLHAFAHGEVGEVYVAYNQHLRAGLYKSVIKKLLPFELNKEKIIKIKEENPFDFKYEPSASMVLDKVLPEAFDSVFYSCFLHSEATEHAARMMAMDNAAKNCDEAIQDLNLKINKKRQASITKELIEIVSGAESL